MTNPFGPGLIVLQESSLLWPSIVWHTEVAVSPKELYTPRCSMVLEYLPTFEPFFGVNVGRYSSTMEHLGYRIVPQFVSGYPRWFFFDSACREEDEYCESPSHPCKALTSGIRWKLVRVDQRNGKKKRPSFFSKWFQFAQISWNIVTPWSLLCFIVYIY